MSGSIQSRRCVAYFIVIAISLWLATTLFPKLTNFLFPVTPPFESMIPSFTNDASLNPYLVYLGKPQEVQ